MSTLCRRSVTSTVGPTDVPPSDELARKPRYQAELYTIFGRKQADDYLHPKMERKKAVKVNPKLQQYGGRAGARTLWGTLRQDSYQKLLQKDQMIPHSLKRAYGAFVRELVLQRGGIPVRRSYYSHDDVPELSQLLDASRARAVEGKRHAFELMARASRANQDTTVILAFNSGEGEESNDEGGIGGKLLGEEEKRYLPSWVDEDDEESVASYFKWLPAIPEHGSVPFNGDESSHAAKGLDTLDGDMADIMLPITKRKRHKRAASVPRLRFLTEEGSKEPGKFAEKYEGERKQFPTQVGEGRLQPKGDNSSVMSDDLQNQTEKASKGTSYATSSATRSRARPSPSSPASWEPLTFNALMEYTKKKSTRGEGEFQHGRTKMFPLLATGAKTSK